MTASHTLVIGGARSGKSRYAEALARRTGLERLYVATATPFDDEMADRIARHRAARAADGWRTVEEQLDLAGALRREAAPERIVLVDCLTLWLTNVMLGKIALVDHRNLASLSTTERQDGVDEPTPSCLGGRPVEAACTGLADALAALPGPVILVSNEVGWGIVPENRLARDFRDAQGRLNQRIAEVCGSVVLVAAGLPLILKGG